MINLVRLTDELRDSVPANGASLVAAPLTTDAGPTTYHSRPEGMVRVTWEVAPSPAQISQTELIVLAHDGVKTEGESLDGWRCQHRVLAAVVLRASTQWTGLSAARKARVQEVIDNAAADITALLS